MTDVSMKALTWNGGLVGVEPLVSPTFDVRPPDAGALRQRADEEVAQWQSRRARAEAILKRLAPMVRTSMVAVTAGAILALALLIGLATGGAGSFYAGAGEEVGPGLRVLGYTLLAGPLFGTIAYASSRKLSKPDQTLGLLKAAGVYVAGVLAGVATFGAGYVLFPLVVGGLALRSRPLLWWQDGSRVQVEPSALGMYKAEREALTQAKQGASEATASIEGQLAEATAAFEQRRRDYTAAMSRWSPFAAIAPLTDRDLLVVGGTAPERGDLVHNLTGAWTTAGPVWILDLRADGAGFTAYEEASDVGRNVGLLDATSADGILALLDELGTTSQRHSPLIEVLSAALAAETESASAARQRETADTLRRIGAVLATGRDRLRVADFHRAMEMLLSGRTAATAGADDFGLGRDGADAPAPAQLSADETRRLREAFTDDERSSFFREWSEIRSKLGTLLHESADQPHAIRWGPGCDVSLSFVSADLPRGDRELRSAMLVEHHINLIRQSSVERPACLIVLGCDDVGQETLQELSKVTDATGVALVLVFADVTDEFRQFARGRRALAVFGGLGAEAAEELSSMLGHEWTRRVQSYQDGWSTSEAQSRSETAGRNWGRSDSVSRSTSRNRGWNSSSSYSDSGSSSSFGTSGGFTTGTSRSVSTNEGESTSETEGTTSTEGRTGSTTEAIEYEQAVRGAEISDLPPFTMLLRIGPDVRPVDVNRDLELPQSFLAQFRPIEVQRHRAAGAPANGAARLPRPQPAGLPLTQ